jgi:hypothetical protein
VSGPGRDQGDRNAPGVAAGRGVPADGHGGDVSVSGVAGVADEQSPPPAYIEQPPPPQYWYYCQSPPGYYPYVGQCPGGWLQVAPRPSAPTQ